MDLQQVSESNTFTCTLAGMSRWDHYQLSLHKYQHQEQANLKFAQVKHRILKGRDHRNNPDKPPRNFRNSMMALDKQAWADDCNSEYLEFVERGAFNIV
jgi:hypothetical protein